MKTERPDPHPLLGAPCVAFIHGAWHAAQITGVREYESEPPRFDVIAFAPGQGTGLAYCALAVDDLLPAAVSEARGAVEQHDSDIPPLVVTEFTPEGGEQLRGVVEKAGPREADAVRADQAVTVVFEETQGGHARNARPEISPVALVDRALADPNASVVSSSVMGTEGVTEAGT